MDDILLNLRGVIDQQECNQTALGNYCEYKIYFDTSLKTVLDHVIMILQTF